MYRVSVQYTPDSDGGGSPFGGGPPGTEDASVPLTIAGRDVTGLSLITTVGGSAKGKVTFEGHTPGSVSPAAISVSATPASAALNNMMSGGSARVRDDWTFEVTGLFDRRRFRINAAPTGWYLKSVTQDGTDVTDTGIDFSQGQKVSNVEIVLTAARGRAHRHGAGRSRQAGHRLRRRGLFRGLVPVGLLYAVRALGAAESGGPILRYRSSR